jgi:DNA-binding MarR family transcriptional regulator
MAALPSWITADLNLSQLKAIVLLEHHGALAVSELAKLLGMGNPAASILVQQLVQQGFAERSEDVKDRRRTFVRLTARGAALIASRREHIQTNLRQWLSQLGDDELASLQHGLGALIHVVQAEQAQESQDAPELAQKHS